MQRLILAACLAFAALAALPPPVVAQPSTDRVCREDDDATARRLLRQTLHQMPVVRIEAPEPPAAGGSASPPSPVPAAEAPPAGTPPAEAAPPAAEGNKPEPVVRPEPPPRTPRTPVRQTAREEGGRLSGSSVRVRVTLEGNDPESWSRVRLRAVARTRDQVERPPVPGRRGQDVEGGNDLCLYRFAGVFAQLHAQDGRVGSIEVDYPRRAGTAIRESWSLVVALYTLDEDKLFGYGTIDVEVGSLGWSAAVSIGLILVIYALLMVAALGVNGRRLRLVEVSLAQAESRAARDPPPLGWRLRIAANPLFLTQDASGIASLARLQLLVFTLAVTFVCAYVFMRTGQLASISEDVLLLLGIAMAGSALARVGGETGSVAAANRIWLKGKGLLIADETRLPRASDLVTADGEMQIARVQAIIFSLLTVAALVWTGPRDLGGFEISKEVLYLLGLSQIAYVAGRAIPAEAVRRLDQEVAALRAAEKQLLQAEGKATVQRTLAAARPEDTARLAEEVNAARVAWNAALAAAEDSLQDVYGEMLDQRRLDELRA